MKRWLANRVAAFLGKRGLQIRKVPFHMEEEIDLRGLLAREIEKSTGRPLRVIQIGANDGVTDDPIRENVLRRRWELLAVEPLLRPFGKLKVNYASADHVRVLNAAAGEHAGEGKMYCIRPLPGMPETDVLSSFDRSVLLHHWRNQPDLESRIEEVAVRVMTVEQLVAEAGWTPELLQVDVEGLDARIILSAFRAGVFPEIVAFEWSHLDAKQMWACRCALIEHGYKWLLCKGDVVAVRKKWVEG
jgi:FkbM family methyltransferase